MKTLDYYNENAEAFVQGTLNADMSEHYQRFLACLPPRSSILDLGCGSGRDTLYFLSQGYAVEATDGSEEVCKLAENNIGKPVRCLRFEDLDYQSVFDGVWACASLLHVTKADMPSIMQLVSRAIKANGVLYASFKYGVGESYSGDRFFNYYTEDDIAVLLKDTGLQCKEYWVSEDVRQDRKDERWLNLIAVKESSAHE